LRINYQALRINYQALKINYQALKIISDAVLECFFWSVTTFYTLTERSFQINKQHKDNCYPTMGSSFFFFYFVLFLLIRIFAEQHRQQKK
jgi:hypothetical protein